MNKPKQQPVDTIFDIPIYFDKFSETFYATVDGRTIRRDTLKLLKADLNSDRVFTVNEPMIRVDRILGNLDLVIVKEIDSYNRLVLSNNNYLRDDSLAPKTEANMELYKRYRQLTSKGWELIHKASGLTHEVTLLPKDYWVKKVKELRKATPPIESTNE